MTTEALKSNSITNLDATPIVRALTGEGGEAMLRAVNDNVTFTTGQTSGSTYRLVRFPRNAHVKHVYLNLDAEVTTFTVEINVAWSDAADGTTASNQGTVPQISSANNELFGSSVDLHDVLTPTDYVAGNTTNFPAGSRNEPLWEVLGYTQDPQGFFDLYLVTTATNSGSAAVEAEVQYTLC